MAALSIARKDLEILFRDRGATIYLFVLPVLFILLFAGLGSGGGSSDGDNRVPLAVVNLDAGGEVASAFIEALDRAGGVRVVVQDQAQVQALLRDAKVARALTIPAGFSEDVAAGRRVDLTLDTHPNSDKRTDESVLRVVAGVVSDMSLERHVLASLQQLADMQSWLPEATRTAFTARVLEQAQSQFRTSAERPLVLVEQVKPRTGAEEAGERVRFDLVQSSVPAYAVLFVFLAAATTARSIFDERQAGSFRRLQAAPVSRWQLLAGKLLPNLATTLLQIAVIFAVGLLLLPLLGWGRLNPGRDPLALVLVSLLIALCSTSLGVFIAAIARSGGQVGGLSTAILWIAAVIGGSLMPSFLLPQAVNAVARFLPHYWANQAYFGLLARGQTLAGVAGPMLALAAFTVAFLAIGLWRFEFE